MQRHPSLSFLFFCVIYLPHYSSSLLSKERENNENLHNRKSILTIKSYNRGEFLTKLIEYDQTSSANIIEIFITDKILPPPNEVGMIIDEFLTPRPWWFVGKEPYTWQNHSNSTKSGYEIRLQKFDLRWIKTLKHMASIQYPVKCESNPMSITVSKGFDSFGNWFYNYDGGHAANPWAVLLPLIIDKDTNDISFLDPHSCPDTLNKFECFFLPPTNCSMPKVALENANRGEEPPRFYNSAGYHGEPIHPEEFVQLRKDTTEPFENDPSIRSIKYYYEADTINTIEEDFSPQQILFAYALLYRLKYDIRSRVAHEIHTFKASFKDYPRLGDCIAIHIRRDKDRAIKGVNMREWCKRHTIVNDICIDTIDNITKPEIDCDLYYDMGCHTDNPYGALSVADYLKASRQLNYKMKVQNIENIYLRTDDTLSVMEELKHIVENRKIFIYNPPPNHRKGSLSSGVSYMTTIALARECSGFVGHSGSAVTNFHRDIFCARHAKVFGECTPFFDFAGRIS